MSSTKIWIPETLKIPTDHKYHDQMLKLVNYLLVKRNARPKNKRTNPIRLSKDLLRSLAGGQGGRHGTRVRDELERIGFLEVVRNKAGKKTYRAKHYPMKVIVNKEHCEAPLVERELNRKPRVKASHNANTKLTSVVKFLLNNLKRISSAHIQFEDLIEADMREKQIKHIRHNLDMLNLGQHYGNRFNRTGRFFSSVTNVNKVIRRKLKIDNQDHVEIDVNSCQPLLLTQLISDHIRVNKQELTDISLEDLDNELTYIKHLCFCGEFYRQFEYVRKSEVLEIDETHKLKTDFCHAFFNYVTGFRRHAFSQAFLRKFPNAWLVVQDLKHRYQSDTNLPANKRHGELPRRLQRMESRCMIDDLVGGIIEDNVDIPVITIHDGILTTAPHIENIKQRIKHSFLQRYGLDVGLSIKL
ncbi:hypothetical protein N9Z08_00240 [Pirellulales bacterium]|nr:hypothetical protein [Pirellulales bacterium]